MTEDLVASGASPAAGRLRISLVSAADLARLERFVREYYVEYGHSFDEDRQPAALAALAAGDPARAPG
jgi:hypothetical protein